MISSNKLENKRIIEFLTSIQYKLNKYPPKHFNLRYFLYVAGN